MVRVECSDLVRAAFEPVADSAARNPATGQGRFATRQNGQVPDFELPRNLAGAGRTDWLAGLPAVVAQAADRWQLLVGRPFQPGGVSSWVAPARSAHGERWVLKIGWPHPEALHEADGLRAWAGQGIVALIDSAELAGSQVLLLEACEPGTMLSQAVGPVERDVVVAALLSQLRIPPPAGHPFRPLQSMCDQWADAFENGPPPALDPGLRRVGVRLFRELAGTAPQTALLCTDLHPDNVLAARQSPSTQSSSRQSSAGQSWLAIDPKPYVGDPNYEPVQHMLNFPDRLVAAPADFARRMATLAGLDADRVRHWLFARCVLESVEQPELIPAVTALAP